MSLIPQYLHILLRFLFILFFICGFALTDAFCDLTPNVKIASQVPHDWSNGLVGYWTMDGQDISGTALTDKSGNGRNGTISGAVGAAGAVGQALKFDGINDYVSIPDNPNFEIPTTNELSVEAWFNQSAYTGTTLVEKRNEWMLYPVDGSGIRFLVRASGAWKWGTTFVHSLNTWYHVVGIAKIENGELITQLWIDGVKKAENNFGAVTPDTTSNPVRFAYDWTDFYNGLIDEVRIYNRALSPAEIQEHYNFTRRKFVVATPNPASWTDGLVGYWRMEAADISGTTLSDKSGQVPANNGTISGAVPVAGAIGQALSFDGASDYINCGSNASLNTPNDYTIEMWAYNGAGSVTYPTLFNRAGQSSSNGFFWCYTGGTDEVNISFQWSTGSSYSSTTFSSVFPKNAWTHLVFVFTNDDKALKLYANGSQFSTTRTLTSALPVDDGTLYLGIYQASSNYSFQGLLDEFRIYNRALSTNEIKEHYSLGRRRLRLE